MNQKKEILNSDKPTCLDLPVNVREIDFRTDSNLIKGDWVCGWHCEDGKYLISVFKADTLEKIRDFTNPDFGEPLIIIDNTLYIRSLAEKMLYIVQLNQENELFSKVKLLRDGILIRDTEIGANCLVKLIGDDWNGNNGHLAYVSIDTMATAWQIEYSAYRALIRENYVFSNNSEGVDSFKLESGESEWHLPISKFQELDKALESLQQELKVFNDVLIVLGSDNGVIGINKNTGEIIWYNSGLETRRCVLSQDGIVYLANRKFVLAIDALTGKEQRRFNLPPVPSLKYDFRKATGVALTNSHFWIGYAYSGNYGGELLALNLETGEVDFLQDFPGLVENLVVRNNRMHFEVMGFGSLSDGPNYKYYILEGAGGFAAE